MSTIKDAEDAVAKVVAAAVRAARDMYPDADGPAIEAYARLLLLRGAIVMKDIEEKYKSPRKGS